MKRLPQRSPELLFTSHCLSPRHCGTIYTPTSAQGVPAALRPTPPPTPSAHPTPHPLPPSNPHRGKHPPSGAHHPALRPETVISGNGRSRDNDVGPYFTLAGSLRRGVGDVSCLLGRGLGASSPPPPPPPPPPPRDTEKRAWACMALRSPRVEPICGLARGSLEAGGGGWRTAVAAASSWCTLSCVVVRPAG